MSSRSTIINQSQKQCRLLKRIILFILIVILCLTNICSIIPSVTANNTSSKPTSIKNSNNNDGITSKFFRWINGDDENINHSKSSSSSIEILSLVEISEMRVRDIKRRLARQHGFGADEIAMMIDKKDLINALAFEEHKAGQKEKERKKLVAFRRSIMVALICVIVVMFKGLFVHVYEVIAVNFVVYTGKFYNMKK